MDREEKILQEYHDTVGTDSLKARNLIKKLDYKENHHYLQCIAQTYLDESRFEDNGTMRIYWDKKKWRMAERYIIKAHIINPDCADVLSVMGEVRKLNGQMDIAIYCFEKIIKLGIKGISYSGCKLNVEHAKEIINDSKFELYRIYHDTNPKLSKRYLAMYKKGLEKGVYTIFKPLKKFLLD